MFMLCYPQSWRGQVFHCQLVSITRDSPQEASAQSVKKPEILHDCEVCIQNIDPAALQYSMQRCRISNRTITQRFLIGLN